MSAETIRLIRDREKGTGREYGGGGRGRLYTYCYTVTTRMTPALRWAMMMTISLIVRDKVTRQCPQTTTFEEKGEPKWNRTEVLLLPSLTTYHCAKLAYSTNSLAGKGLNSSCV